MGESVKVHDIHIDLTQMLSQHKSHTVHTYRFDHRRIGGQWPRDMQRESNRNRSIDCENEKSSRKGY